MIKIEIETRNKDKIKIEIDDNGAISVSKPTEKKPSEPTSMDFAKALENVEADKQYIDCKELFKPNDPERLARLEMQKQAIAQYLPKQ